MIDERRAGHEHPRQILRRKADEDERARAADLVRRLPARFLHRNFAQMRDALANHEDQRGQTRPPYSRIAHAGNRGNPALRHELRARIIPHRLDNQRPLVPRRAEVVRVVGQPLVVVEHMHLRAPHALKAQPAGRFHIPVIREIVDRNRHGNEHDHAEQAGNDRILPEFFARAVVFLALIAFFKCADVLDIAADERREEQHRQPRACVDADPLAGNAKPHEQAAQSQRNQRLPEIVGIEVHLAVSEHEQIHEQYEEHAIGIDRGDARLRKVHRIEREQQHANRRIARLFEQLLDEQIHDRQHEHAEQRPHKAPAERRHAEQLDAQHDEHLAQRRVRRLVGIHVVRELITRARVIDLVEIGAVIIARMLGHGVLLVDQQMRVLSAFRVRAFARNAGNRQYSAVFIEERHLMQHQSGLLGGDADIARRLERIATLKRGELAVIAAFLRGIPQPAEDLPLIVFGQPILDPGFAVV